MNYLWDTNTAIYYLHGRLSKDAEAFMDRVVNLSIPSISAITEIELLCWRAASDNDLIALKNFIADSVVFDLDRDIKEKTIELRKTYATKLPDAIIAATAFTNGYTLISRNIKDFNKIEGLKLINPFIF